MPAIAAIVIKDGAATPADKTFGPVNVNADGIASYADRTGGIALGYPMISASVRQPTKGSRNFKVVIKVVTPVLEVTSPSTSTGIQPAPTKAYDLTSLHEFILPERSTLAQRNDILAFAKNLLSNAQITSLVQNLESVY
jgi:hypothetical protein